MNIAFVSSDHGPCPPIRGGAIQLVISQVAPILAKDHRVTVFSVDNPELPAKEVQKGVLYRRFPKEEFVDNVISQALKDRFDVILIYNRPEWITRIKQSGVESPCILSLHNLIFKTKRTTVKAARAGLEKADFILTVSRYVLQDTIRKVPKAKRKIKVLYTGVNIQEYAPVWSRLGRKWRSEIRTKYGIGKHDPVILFAGRLIPEKGCHVAIKAMQKIIRKHKDAKLLVVGSSWYADNSISPYMEKLHTLSRKLDKNIVFTSYVPVEKMPKFYAASDVFVCASQWKEPLARVHYEAMAAGLPIITTNRGGNREVIQEGKNGLIINRFKQPSQYAVRISRLLSNRQKRKQIGKFGHAKAIKYYNFQRVASELEAVCRKLAKKHHNVQGGGP